MTRRGWTLAGAVAVVVVVVGIVAVFGVRPYPSPATVAESPSPAPTARLAYVRYDDGACLHVVDADGEDRELGCGATFEGELLALSAGRVGVRSYRTPDPVVDVIDLATGAVLATEEADPDDPAGLHPERGDGAVARTGEGDGVVWVEVTDPEGGTARVLELDAPDDYGLYQVGWTPDGDWLVVVDSLSRALVVPADGGEPRIWATEVGDAVALPAS
ncbi:hypothetical protein [Euzebya sp.]|uniref:hypothetical protein n=1 Tax=Euzebya sp. TaxID=1971409 RepID=UPI0035142869